MKMKNYITLGLSLAFIAGCTPNYGPRYYSEQELSPDRYEVHFTGNTGWSKGDAVEDLTLLRSAELTLDRGYRYFVVPIRRYSFEEWTPPALVQKPVRDALDGLGEDDAIVLTDPTILDDDGRVRCAPGELPMSDGSMEPRMIDGSWEWRMIEGCKTSFPSSTSLSFTFEITMFREKPDADELVVYDAVFVQRVLRRKYELESSPRPPDRTPRDSGM
jgi:hypothetical protein